MCGIAGVVDRRGPVDPAVVDTMLGTLLHRGPDSFGTHRAVSSTVGQTRLAVIDLVTGDPPITTPDGRIGVAFNGEIYNYAALRSELIAGGHAFRTTGDTEVIAHLAEDLEPIELARRLHGMFAVAVTDDRTGRVVLVRDRLGKKPLYWYRGTDVVVFASEIKALLAHPAVPRQLDADAIPAYLGLGYVPTPRTFFAGIESVPPGHVVTIERDLQVRVTPYWTPPLPGVDGATALDVDDVEAARLVRDEVERAVHRRLVSDVPLGAFLSGGIDSTVVVGLMAGMIDRPVQTFTIGFEEGTGFDERPFARLAADRFATDHHEFVVSPDAADLVASLVHHHDQPFGDSSALPMYLLSELTRRHVTVALSGDGGDEVFGGYERLAAALAVARLGAAGALVGTPARLAARHLPLPTRVARFATAMGSGMPDALRRWTAYVPDDVVDQLTPGAAWARRDYAEHWAASAGGRPLDRILRLNLDTYLLDDLLPKVDRTSMAHGLEVRSPLLDHQLVELAFRLPPGTRIRGTKLKRVLRDAFQDLVPAEILTRRKKGFGVPLGRWFRTDLAPLAASLGRPSGPLAQHLDVEVVRALVAEHASGRVDHGHALWTLLTLDLFLERMAW